MVRIFDIHACKNFKKMKLRPPFVVAIGTFDGVHLAHQAVIKRTVAIARRQKGTSIILTFFPHPLRITAPHRIPALLTSLEHRLQLISRFNPDACCVVDFNKSFARLSAEEFIKKFLKDTLNASWVVVGEKFNFGRDRLGNIELLKQQGERFNYKLTVVPALKRAGEVISSSLIRESLGNGRLDIARALLGRQFSILGTVVKGDRRGSKLGYPTANIRPHQEALPPNGVYAVKVRLQGRLRKGMLYIGTRPTFYARQTIPTIEVHLFNFRKDIYNEHVEIFFIRRIREDKKFSGHEMLVRQLRRDEKKVRKLFGG
ncbi:MAG: bifunctional riboflavin kinase/FAD synthetase [Candidatus Omnitrophica bacterium]|nr:bifunctional riboflavin kinase/FAD synthetase [Candidatus Omnitrophota bacterium]MBU4478221.1 bifunctional riboflavin kinase/FAD synthetase [Candidatus Omnitrophota bacterium]MCG2703379.1 bifunctional riboflavin kinase/FAD synthetase [Candidatus Omnitrophota bacterium]